MALLLTSLALYFFAPFQLLGVAFVYERFATMIVPGAILASTATPPLLSQRARRVLVAALSLIWLLIPNRGPGTIGGCYPTTISSLRMPR